MGKAGKSELKIQDGHSLIPKHVQDIAQAVMAEHGLSKMQITVIKWTADGKHNNEISEILSITEKAVQAHIRRAMNSLGASSRTGLVAYCLRNKIIE